MRRTDSQNKAAGRSLSKRAFSLTELAMAIGIMSFGLVSTLGVLPVGMMTLKTSRERTVASQIANKLSGTVQSADFESLASIQGTNYYTADGQPTSEIQQSVFVGEIKGATDPEYVGKPVGIGQSLRVVRVQVRPRLGTAGIEPIERVIFVPRSG